MLLTNWLSSLPFRVRRRSRRFKSYNRQQPFCLQTKKLDSAETLEERVLLSAIDVSAAAFSALDTSDVQTSVESSVTAEEVIADGSVVLTSATSQQIDLQQADALGTLSVEPGQRLYGSGEFAGTVVNHGLLGPGHSPGIQNFDSFTQDASGTLEIEIGGLTAGPGDSVVDNGYDQINVAGQAQLDGTLEISLINGFEPSAGDTFDFLTFDSVEGKFAEGEGLYGFGDGTLFFEVVQQTDRLQLVAKQIPWSGQLSPDLDNQAMNDALGQYYSDYFVPNSAATVSGNLNLAGGITISGTFSFDVAPTTTVTVGTGLPGNVPALPSSVEREVSIVTVGATNTHIFFGINGPYLSDTNGDGVVDSHDTPNGDSVGLSLEGVAFGLALMKSAETADPSFYYSLGATADRFQLVGVDGIELAADQLTVAVNAGKDILNPLGDAAVDFKKSFETAADANDGVFLVPTGGEPVALGYDGNYRVGASAEDARMDLLDFVHLQGSFSFEQGPQQLVEIATGVPANLGAALDTIGLQDIADTIASVGGVTIGENFSTISGWDVATMMVGASDVDGFLGYGDPDFANPEWAQGEDLVGFVLDGLDVGLGLMDSTFPTPIPGLEQFFGMKAEADTVSFAGGGEWLNVEANDVDVVINDNPDTWPGALGPAVIDWGTTAWGDGDEAAGLQIATGAKKADGSDVTMTLDMDGNQRIGASVEDARLDLLDFVHLQGSFFFEKGPQQLVEIATGIPASLGAALDEIGLQDIADTIAGVGGVTIGENFSTISGWDVATMMVGASGVDGFAGIGDPDCTASSWTIWIWDWASWTRRSRYPFPD